MTTETVTNALLPGVLGLVFAGLLISLSLARSARPYLSSPGTLRAWCRLLMSTPGAARIVGTSMLGYTASVPSFDAWFRTDGGAVRGRAMRVHVPIDHVARLDFTDGWGNGRLLDSSAFCLATGSASSEVEFLARGTRTQIVYGDVDGLRSSDGYPVQCHLAAHLSVPNDIGSEAEWNWLFDNASTLGETLRRNVAGRLRDAFGVRPYRSNMYDAPNILSQINDDASAGDLVPGAPKALEIRFTALVVKPRERAERNLLVAATTGHEVLKEQTDAINEDIARSQREWLARWKELFRNLEHSLGALHAEVDEAINAASAGLASAIPAMNTDAQVLQSVRSVFETGRGQFVRSSRQVLTGFDDLHQFIADLNAEHRSLYRAARATPTQPQPPAAPGGSR